MDLAPQRAELEVVQLLVRYHERERRARRPGAARDPAGHGSGRPSPDGPPRTIDDHAIGVDDREGQDLRRAGLAIRSALPGELRSLPVSRGRGSSGAPRAKREMARMQRAHRGATELLVRVDRVLADAVVEKNRAGN